MKDVGILLTGLAVAVATILAGSTEAHAQRRMLVLIDASGSMSLARPGDAVNPTRFAAAKARSTQQVLAQEMLGLSGVAVYTFRNSSATARTAGFVSVNAALDAIEALDPTVDVGGVTPLAGSMCDAVDALVTDGGATKILQVSSDGEENATPIGHLCQGPYSASAIEPFTSGSWQNKVYNHAVDHVIVRIDLFNPAPIVSFAARAASAPDPEGNVTMMARSFAAAATNGDRPPTLEEFFGILARDTGGQLTVIHDNEPLPVYADMNGDRCVDSTDAILTARNFGAVLPAVDGKFDLDLDGIIDFGDYSVVLQNISGDCGSNPYRPAQPISCKGSDEIVIEGSSIDSPGITIETRGSCHITIKDSLIVSGKNAINIIGSAIVTVDNSIIVGESAVVVLKGSAKLSAANTVFHGKKKVDGRLEYKDRGGNIWE